jgi:protein-tyrosine phosphatase
MQSTLLQSGFSLACQVDSCGTAGYHIGRPPDSRMIAAASKRGYDLTSRAQQFSRTFLSGRDLIVAMDRDNYREIQSYSQGVAGNVKLFSDFLDSSWPVDVPDPYYGGDDGFEYVLDMLEAGCPKILEEIRSKLVNPAVP